MRGALHPGGGGQSQWYHRYDRRFDSLLALRPQPAPFSVELAEPWNPRYGENRLSLVFSNNAESPVKLKFRCLFHERSPSAEPTSAQPTWQRGERVQHKVRVTSATLRGRMNRLLDATTATARENWSELFLEASALRDRLLLDRIDFERQDHLQPLGVQRAERHVAARSVHDSSRRITCRV